MTMDLGDLLAADGIVPTLKVKSKKQALQELATRAASVTGLEFREIYDTLFQRERLGSTGLGRGVAIPHVKFRSLRNIVCCFAPLEVPIDSTAWMGNRSTSSSSCWRRSMPAAII